MATKTFEELKQLAIQIRDEKTNKQNTATRVGTAMLEHINKLEQDYYDKTKTDEELKERDDKLTELSENIEIVGKGANYEVLVYEVNIATTRLKVPENNRKAGYMITYNPGTGWIKEQYIGLSVTNDEWIKNENWKVEITNDNIQSIADNAQQQAELAAEKATIAMTQATYANEQANNAKAAAEAVTSEVLKTMPVGTVMMSANGNIFGEDWIKSGGFIVNDFEEIPVKEAQTYASYQVFSDDDMAFVVLDTKLYHSQDGHMWNECNMRFNSEDDTFTIISLSGHPYSKDIYYAVAFSFSRMALLKSTDGGINWNEVDYPFGGNIIIGLIKSGVYLYAIGSNICYISSIEDEWVEEEAAYNINPGDMSDFSMTAYKNSTDIGVVVVLGNSVYRRKSFSGHSWELLGNFTNTNVDEINYVYVSYSESKECWLIATSELRDSVVKLYKSQDLRSWDDITETLPYASGYVGFNVIAGDVFVLRIGGDELIYSADLNNWTRKTSPSRNNMNASANGKNMYLIEQKGILYICDNPLSTPEIPFGYVKIK